jgi:hypothetical protein
MGQEAEGQGPEWSVVERETMLLEAVVLLEGEGREPE